MKLQVKWNMKLICGINIHKFNTGKFFYVRITTGRKIEIFFCARSECIKRTTTINNEQRTTNNDERTMSVSICFECKINKRCENSVHYCQDCKNKIDAENQECDRLRKLHIERQNAYREEIIADLLASEKKQPRKPSPPKKEECPLSPAELKAIPPRPPAKIRSPAGSLIDNKAKQVQWDNKYSIYKKWL